MTLNGVLLLLPPLLLLLPLPPDAVPRIVGGGGRELAMCDTGIAAGAGDDDDGADVGRGSGLRDGGRPLACGFNGKGLRPCGRD